MKTTEKSQFISAMQSPERFKILEDGWIQDSFTGLDLGKTSSKRMNFQDAEKYCADQGGRLPEIHELHSLVDFTKEQPASYSILNTEHDDWYWSATQTAWSKESKIGNRSYWCVSFFSGFVNDSGESYNNYVRPVRASQ